jgi:hypothetical protein
MNWIRRKAGKYPIIPAGFGILTAGSAANALSHLQPAQAEVRTIVLDGKPMDLERRLDDVDPQCAVKPVRIKNHPVTNYQMYVALFRVANKINPDNPEKGFRYLLNDSGISYERLVTKENELFVLHEGEKLPDLVRNHLVDVYGANCNSDSAIYVATIGVEKE